MCPASCLGMNALKFSVTGLCECSEVLWHWDKQGSPPVHAAPGTVPCSDPSKAYCLHSRVPVSVWHPRTPTASPDTGHSESLKTAGTACSGITRPLGVLDPLLRPLSSQVTLAHPQSCHNTLLPSQARRTGHSTLSLLCTEWSKASFYGLDPMLLLICSKSSIRRLQPRAHPLP